VCEERANAIVVTAERKKQRGREKREREREREGEREFTKVDSDLRAARHGGDADRDERDCCVDTMFVEAGDLRDEIETERRLATSPHSCCVRD
jgi:hypothetical protein